MPRKTCSLKFLSALQHSCFNEAAARCRGKPDAVVMADPSGNVLQ